MNGLASPSLWLESDGQTRLASGPAALVTEDGYEARGPIRTGYA